MILIKGQKVLYNNEIYTVDTIGNIGINPVSKFQISILQHDAQGNIKKRQYITALNINKVRILIE